MSNPETYDEEYFLRGKQSGKSLYENYRWLPELTIPMAEKIVLHCGMEHGQRILDFGCAMGFLVRALRILGYNAFGYDHSRWAIENADQEVKHYLTGVMDLSASPQVTYDWIIAKDVLEHVEYVDLTINNLMNVTIKGLFVVVPLSSFDGGTYVVEEYEKDVTHTQRFTLASWARMFMRPGWSVTTSYQVKGVKDNYAQYVRGNGFLTVRRLAP